MLKKHKAINKTKNIQIKGLDTIITWKHDFKMQKPIKLNV